MHNETKCRLCGCTEHNACEGGCSWVSPELCSACFEKLQEVNEKVMNNKIGLNYLEMPKKYLAEALCAAVANLDHYENICGYSLEDDCQNDERDWKDHYYDHKAVLVKLVDEKYFDN